MNRTYKPRRIDIPPHQWSYDDLNKAFQIVNQINDSLYTIGGVVCSSIQIIGAPESGYGLPDGGVYVDPDGFLKIVRTSDVFAPSFDVRVKLRNVTVST